MMSLPTTTTGRHCGASCLTPEASGRVRGWRHHNEPFHNYKVVASRCAITFRRKSGRVQEELNMIHYSGAAACLFTRVRAEESIDFIEAHCGVPSRKIPYKIVIYLYVCVLDLSYFRVRVSLRM